MSRYKDPKTGNTYDDISDARDAFCGGKQCHDCPLRSCTWESSCGDWREEHPEEAARVMGLEAIDEPAAVKPRLAEVLGVEVGERFYVGTVRNYPLYVDERGDLLIEYGDGKRDYADCATLCALIQHPDYVTKLTRLTDAEIAIIKGVRGQVGEPGRYYRWDKNWAVPRKAG